MDNRILWLLGGIAAYVYYQNSQTPGSAASDSAVTFASNPLASVSDVIVASTAGWKSVGDGQTWIDTLNAAEIVNGIPADLLARIAYQESHFRADIITGAKASPAGALGMMQLMPQYFTTVRVPRPFTSADTQAQILEAANLLKTNYNSTQDWSLAVAAYNAGLGAVHKAGGIPQFPETLAYVAAIMADIPAAVNA
jgi:soluble lytic murein transglycosylase-like protein